MTSTAYSSRLRIDLDALRSNYRTIAARIAPARCGAVVKADAYGLGGAPVVAALAREGCRTFFVAQFCEARRLARTIASDAEVFILNGIDPGNEGGCIEGGFIPVLNSHTQVAQWRAFAHAAGSRLPAALQVDTGMSRLGLDDAAAAALANDPAFARDIDLRLLMTHLACADEPESTANTGQLERFRAIQARFPGVPGSIANSGGTFLGPQFHADLARPGLALFGVEPGPHAAGLQPVVRLEARILQIREIEAGTGVGYGLDHTATARERIATVAIGYGDGWPRSLGAVGAAWHQGVRLPILGRISMDSMAVDLDPLPHNALQEGDCVELIGPSQSLTEVARDAGTIAYEILTRLGPRHARFYTENGTARGADAPGDNP